MKILFLDTETTGLPPKQSTWENDYVRYPYLVEVAWQVYHVNENLLDLFPRLIYETSHLIYPDGWEIPPEATAINKISTQMAKEQGMDQKAVLRHLIVDASQCDKIAGHNVYFDTSIIKANLLRLGIPKDKFNDALAKEKRIDTMVGSMDFARSVGFQGKWLKLVELYKILFDEELKGAHSALYDVQATARCFFRLAEKQLIKY